MILNLVTFESQNILIGAFGNIYMEAFWLNVIYFGNKSGTVLVRGVLTCCRI